jgi:hypothetical protein
MRLKELADKARGVVLAVVRRRARQGDTLGKESRLQHEFLNKVPAIDTATRATCPVVSAKWRPKPPDGGFIERGNAFRRRKEWQAHGLPEVSTLSA